jgi:hypothetical protein
MRKERQILLDKIDKFRERYGVPETRFGRECANDPNLIERLRTRRSVLDTTIERIEVYMRDYKGSKPRPKPKHQEAAA